MTWRKGERPWPRPGNTEPEIASTQNQGTVVRREPFAVGTRSSLDSTRTQLLVCQNRGFLATKDLVRHDTHIIAESGQAASSPNVLAVVSTALRKMAQAPELTRLGFSIRSLTCCQLHVSHSSCSARDLRVERAELASCGKGAVASFATHLGTSCGTHVRKPMLDEYAERRGTSESTGLLGCKFKQTRQCRRRLRLGEAPDGY